METEGGTQLVIDRVRGAVIQALKKSPSIPSIRVPSSSPRKRRASHDEGSLMPVFKVWVDHAIETILEQEDTDNNMQITILDRGPKALRLGTLASDGGNTRDIRGTYQLANLLEELYLAKGKYSSKVIHFNDVSEDPVDRIERKIREQFWDNLTRRLDESMIADAAPDPKDWNEHSRPRIYVPASEEEQYNYYLQVAEKFPSLDLDVQYLPRGDVTPDFVHGLRDRPGLLALEMDFSNPERPRGLQFIVPGGRFNECYYWDSYFCCIGLISVGKIDIAWDIIKNFAFQVRHYGRILNANRSYYLCRSQPPFLTDLVVRSFHASQDLEDRNELLRLGILAAIKEYYQVWAAEPRYDPVTGLSRFRPMGTGIHLEVEQGHFDPVLSSYAKKYDIDIPAFIKKYNAGEIHELELDVYFLHDRAVRESGHDTSYRFEQGAADIATVDLNCLLYKYEVDIAWAIKHIFGNQLQVPAAWRTADMNADHVEMSETWSQRARQRKVRVNTYLWDDTQGMYYDYDTRTCQQTSYMSVTALYPLWCGIASTEQAAKLVKHALPKFECVGGLSSSTEESRGPVGTPDRPMRQWDYPFGWAPHQILVWDGMKRYGYIPEMERLVYRWLQLMVRVAFNHHGAIVEKYDVTRLDNPALADAEYGSQGLPFKYANVEGFGWSNASFSYGLSLIRHRKVMIRALNLCVPYEDLNIEGVYR